MAVARLREPLCGEDNALTMRNVFILVLALAMAFGSTIPKLYTMCQIKGWCPGAKAAAEIITQKWNQTPAEHPLGLNTYWITWTDDDIRALGVPRLSISPGYWNTLRVGDEIEVIRLPGEYPHLRNDFFVSATNFAYNGALLVLEIGVAGTMAGGLIRTRHPATNVT